MPLIHLRACHGVALMILSSALLVSGAGVHAAIADDPPPTSAPSKPRRPKPADTSPTTPPAATPDAGAADAALPDAKEIIRRHVEAIGGEERLRQYTSRELKAELRIPAMGVSNRLTVKSIAPDKLLITMHLPGYGDSITGFDGEHGWTVDPSTGPMLLGDEQLTQLRRDADFYKDLHYDRYFPTMKTTGRETFDERDCYAVTLTSPDGEETMGLFDVANGYLVGLRTHADRPTGPVDTVTFFRDYTDYGGIKLPRVTATTLPQVEQEIVVHSVQWNTVDGNLIVMPPALKKQADDPSRDPGFPVLPGGQAPTQPK